MMTKPRSQLFRVARIGKPHGTRGEVTVQVFTDAPETRFAEGSILEVKPPEGEAYVFESLTVAKARWNKTILLLKFAEFSDRNTAEILRDSELYAPAHDSLSPGSAWYREELLNFSVHLDSMDSRAIGKVADLYVRGLQDLLVVKMNDGREVLLPFVKEIVPEVNEERGAIVITPPAGLLELNQD